MPTKPILSWWEVGAQASLGNNCFSESGKCPFMVSVTIHTCDLSQFRLRGNKFHYLSKGYLQNFTQGLQHRKIPNFFKCSKPKDLLIRQPWAAKEREWEAAPAGARSYPGQPQPQLSHETRHLCISLSCRRQLLPHSRLGKCWVKLVYWSFSEPLCLLHVFAMFPKCSWPTPFSQKTN